MGVAILLIYGPLLIILFFASLRISKQSIEGRKSRDPKYKMYKWQFAVGFLLSSITTVLITFLLNKLGSKETMVVLIWVLAPNIIVPFVMSSILRNLSQATIKIDSHNNSFSNSLINYAAGALNTVWLFPALVIFALVSQP